MKHYAMLLLGMCRYLCIHSTLFSVMYTTITGKISTQWRSRTNPPHSVHQFVNTQQAQLHRLDLGLRLWSVQQNYSVVNYCGSTQAHDAESITGIVNKGNGR